MRVFQLIFWLAIATTLYLCLQKPFIAVPTSDKTQHLMTFGMLTFLMAMAHPRAKLSVQAFALSGFGALIEFIQPYFGRDKDVKDWIADTIGILIVLAIVWIARRLIPAAQGA